MSLPLLHSPADILRQVLTDLGEGTDPINNPGLPWPVYDSNEPSTPDNCLTVYDTTPQSDGRSMIDGETFTHHGFQLRIRSVDHPTGWTKGESCRKTLDEEVLDNLVTLDGTPYRVHSVTTKHNLLTLGKDTPNTKRSLFTLNGLVSLARLS